MRMKLNQLFNRNILKSFVKKIQTNILKIMFKFLKMIKKANLKINFRLQIFRAMR